MLNGLYKHSKKLKGTHLQIVTWVTRIQGVEF
jgi:hypothetical protein